MKPRLGAGLDDATRPGADSLAFARGKVVRDIRLPRFEQRPPGVGRDPLGKLAQVTTIRFQRIPGQPVL